MNRNFDKIRDLLYCGLDDLSKSNTLDRSSVEMIGQIVDALKDMDQIEMDDLRLEDEYSNRYNGMSMNGGNSYMMGNSYARGMGGRTYNRGYSRDEGRDYLMNQVRNLMHQSTNEGDRKAIENLLNQLESNR